MVMQRGVWALWSRGQNPTATTQWKDVSEHYGPNMSLETMLTAFMLMKQQNQHVRLEWMPENAYGNVPKANGEQHPNLTEEKEAMAWGYAPEDTPTYV